MDEKGLIQSAWKARQKAYAPYSGFKVGAVLLGKGGRHYAGCNVENASFGLTLCAERNALARAVAQGERAFVKLLIVADSREPVLPCGACCQVLAEFAPDLAILSVYRKGKRVRTTLSELLPKAFRLRPEKG